MKISVTGRNNVFTGTVDDFMTYSGTKAVTVSGRACQEWRSSYPHPHSRANNPEDATVENNHNYCRLVRSSRRYFFLTLSLRNVHKDVDGPWCYTTDPNKEWEVCFTSMSSDSKIDGN